MMISLIILILLLIVIILLQAKTYFYRKISFKESLDLIDLPVIVFKQGDIKLNLLLDTGASYSVINQEVCDSIKYTATTKYTIMYGVDGIPRKAPNINIRMSLDNTLYTERFQVADISAAINDIKKDSGVTIHGILGNSFMQKYKYVLDFDKMIAYSKKLR